jgi:hypothetical protein
MKLISFAAASQYDQLLRIPQVRKEARVSGCSGAILDLPFFVFCRIITQFFEVA